MDDGDAVARRTTDERKCRFLSYRANIVGELVRTDTGWINQNRKGIRMEGKKGPTTIDEYIAQVPEDVQPVLNKIRAVIKESAPGATERISYQMPAFYLNGNLVYFGAHPHHIGFYPTGSGIEAFKEELSGYKWSKGAVQFPLDQPIPYDLISRITRFRVAENLKKAPKEKSPARDRRSKTG
jgi:uncharacterized protein YdhG (YjbR/CyaY superfamily)